MINLIRRSISNKLLLVAMATSFIALLAYGVAMLAYDLRTYRATAISDLETQANIIAEISAPTLEFDDPATAKENLALLRTRPMILGAAVFTPAGRRFADYSNVPEQQLPWPEVPQFVDKYAIEGNQILVWKRMVRNGELLGAVYIHARYEARQRLSNYAIILACVMGASLGLALLIASWLRGAVTKPIFAVTKVARHVMQSRDFSLRAQKFTDDEIGVLVDAFNDMLGEVQRRASALEESNLSLGREMAERHAAEAALRLADQRKDEFLATLAHELRNPLAPMTNALQILKLLRQNPEAIGTAEAVMERQLKQMVRLVDDLLDVSRINTGKLAISKSRVDVQSVMRDAIESSGLFIKTSGHMLSVDMPDEPVYIEADSLRLAQVFSNLLNNAAKYTNRGGLISFTAQVEGLHIIVKVTDDGIGIAPHMLGDIFNMFIQVDQSLERAQAGLGVGLALSKHLVELHGYELRVDSEGAGKGSQFSVRLKLIAPGITAVENKVEATEKSGAHHRIMLVDDNVDFVTTMAALLTTMGHEVRIAHDGITAQEIAREFAPEFAFLDIGMPGMNGYDLAKRLREFPETAQSTLVAITGWGQEKDRELSRNAGFDHHLVKPVATDKLLNIIQDRN